MEAIKGMRAWGSRVSEFVVGLVVDCFAKRHAHHKYLSQVESGAPVFRTVALVPLAMSYELLPEDGSLYREICGLPRDPLRTMDFVWWVLRGLRGELPPLGEAFMRFGVLHTLDASANVDSLVSEVQRELVELTSVTTLHCRALGEVLGFEAQAVMDSLEGQVALRSSSLDKPGPLPPAECWPLVLQAQLLRNVFRVRDPRYPYIRKLPYCPYVLTSSSSSSALTI